MGFSVTASHIIFGIALLGAFSAASAAYWKSAEEITESRRIMDERVINAAHSNLTMVGTPTYNGGGDWYRFTVKNVGSVVLDFSRFTYLIDGQPQWTYSNGWPKLNGAGTTSVLLAPGDELEVRLDNIASSPTDLSVTTEYGISLYYP